MVCASGVSEVSWVVGIQVQDVNVRPCGVQREEVGRELWHRRGANRATAAQKPWRVEETGVYRIQVSGRLVRGDQRAGLISCVLAVFSVRTTGARRRGGLLWRTRRGSWRLSGRCLCLWGLVV